MKRNSRAKVFCEQGVLRNFTKFTGKHLCQSLSSLLKKETLAQVFSCKFCEISKNTFFYRLALVAASEWSSTGVNLKFLVILATREIYAQDQGMTRGKFTYIISWDNENVDLLDSFKTNVSVKFTGFELNLRGRRQFLLLILSEFKRINFFSPWHWQKIYGKSRSKENKTK